MINKIIKKLSKPLTLDFINNHLRSKGIATSERGDKNLTFKLYDMNWDLYCENGRLGLRNSMTLGSDIDMQCMHLAANRLNNERWIVKAFIDTYNQNEDGNDSPAEVVSSVIFSFEGFCHSKSEFVDMYEFAIYALTDGIEFHRKAYSEFLNQRNHKASPIGFRTDEKQQGNMSVTTDNHKRNKIGFV